MKAAIVTGATGFLGTHLTRELLARGVSVTAVVRDRRKAEALLPQNDKLTLTVCDMDDYETLGARIARQEDRVFFHLAWDGVYGTGRSDLSVQLRNVRAAALAAQAAAQLGCRAFVGLGTIMERESLAVAEADGSAPGAGYLYGEAKHFAHLQTKIVCAQSGVPHLWAVLTNAYGEGDTSTRLVSSALRKALRGEKLEFTAGTQLYDFIHVSDTVCALCAIAERGKAGHAYVIGSGSAAPLRGFLERLGSIAAPNAALHFGAVPYTGVQLRAEEFSIASLTRDTGFVPTIPFEEGIRRTVEWLRETEGQAWTR